MKKIIKYLFVLLFISCTAQDIRKTKNNDMKSFVENNYKEWVYDPEHALDNTTWENLMNKEETQILYLSHNNERCIIIRDFESHEIVVSKFNTITPYRYDFYYSDKTKVLTKRTQSFYNCEIGFTKEFDSSGKLRNETNNDQPYSFSINNLIAKFKTDYNIDLEDKKKYNNRSLYTSTDVRRVSFDKCSKTPLYMIDITQNYTTDAYFIDANTGLTLFHEQSDSSSFIPYQDFCKAQASKNQTYKTHNGISYTQAEWEAYKEKEYEEYCRRTGRTYTPKDQANALENNSSKGKFEADETDLGTPKSKKGFWDNLLG